MDEFEQRARFEKLLRRVEIEGETREELLEQRLIGFYIGLVIGVPIPLALLMIHASRRDVRPLQLIACLALLVFGAATTALLGAILSPRVMLWLEEKKDGRRKS